jgi:hypothetical protein
MMASDGVSSSAWRTSIEAPRAEHDASDCLPARPAGRDEVNQRVGGEVSRSRRSLAGRGLNNLRIIWIVAGGGSTPGLRSIVHFLTSFSYIPARVWFAIGPLWIMPYGEKAVRR